MRPTKTPRVTFLSALADFYRDKYPAISSQRSSDISNAGAEIAAIYNRNVFPDLKVTWGTYPNNLGHTDFPGCFRCHDGSHSTVDKKMTITQDCNTCHEPLAVEEASPGVLKTVGLADRIASLQKRRTKGHHHENDLHLISAEPNGWASSDEQRLCRP